MYLFGDVETTGLTATAEIAQFACLLFDENRKLVGQFKSLIKPDGWVMPEETAKMVAAGRTNFKPPSLQEAHKFCFGEGFDGAHDALADVWACARIFWWYQDRQKAGVAA